MSSENATLRQASISVIPGIVQHVEVPGVDSRSLVMAMVERLKDKEEEVVQAAVKALLGVRGLLGDSARKYIDSLKLNQFKQRESPVKKPVPPERREVVEETHKLGVVPIEVFKALQIDDWKVRSTAIEKLLMVIRQVEDPKPLVPHLKGLVRLVGPLLDDPNFKIALTSIQITGELVDKAGVDMAGQATNLMPLLVEKFGDKKIVIRQGTMKVLVKLMREIGAGAVINQLLPFSSHKNPHVREEVLNAFMHGILMEGVDAIDLPAVVRTFRNGLFDAKDRVRFIAMEAFALLRNRLGEVAVEQFLAGIGDDVVRPLQMRFKDKSLPVIGESGLVEHGSRDSMSSAATSQDLDVGQRPRHQSAGPHQGKIPWKMPTLKSRVGPSQNGRRNRSAAAVIISNNKKEAIGPDGRAITTGGERDFATADSEYYPSSASPMSSAMSHGVDGGFDMDGIHAPHVSMDWKRHADTEDQVDAALRGGSEIGVSPLYNAEAYSPSFGSKKTPRPSSRHSPIHRIFGQLDADTWQSVSPTTPASSHFPFPGGNTYQGRSISPGLSGLSPVGKGPYDRPHGGDVLGKEPDSSYSSSKTSLWLPGVDNSRPQRDHPAASAGGSSRTHPHVGQGPESGMQHPPSAPPAARSKALATLKTKRKVPQSAATTFSGEAMLGPGDVMTTHDIGREATVGDLSFGGGGKGGPGLPKPSLSHVSTKRREMQRQKHKAEMSKGGEETAELGGLMGDLVMGKKMGQGPEGGGAKKASSREEDRKAHSREANNGAREEASRSGEHPSLGQQAGMTFIAREDLEPCQNVNKELRGALEGLKTDKWDQQLEATTTLRRIIKYHAQALRPCVAVLMKDLFGKDAPVMSLRSNLSRNALTCVADLLEKLGRDFDPHLEEISKLLMNKCSEASGFINAESEKALMSLVDNTSESKALNALLGTANHRNPTIRGKTALFVDRCIQRQGTRLQPKDLERLMPVLLSFINNSSEEARAYGKRSIYHMYKTMPGELERTAKRVLPAIGYAKIEQTIETGKHNGGFGVSNESGSSNRASRFGSSRNKPVSYDGGLNDLSIDTASHSIPKGKASPSRGGASIPSELIDVFNGWLNKLASSDWKTRIDAIEGLMDFIKKHKEVCKSKMVPLMDAMEPRLNDGNTKVIVRALEAMQEMVLTIGNGLTAILDNLIASIGNCVASTNTAVVNLASGVVDCLFGCVEKAVLVKAMCKTVSYGNARVKTGMLNKLAEVAREIYVEDPRLISSTVIPMVVNTVETEMKGDVRKSVNSVLVCLHAAMQGAFFSELENLDLDVTVMETIKAAVQTGSERKNVRR